MLSAFNAENMGCPTTVIDRRRHNDSLYSQLGSQRIHSHFKAEKKEQHVSFIEDVAVPQAIEYEQKTSTRDQYDQLIIHDLRKILNENELEIIYALYFGQQTVSEIAQRKNKTRQAVNQTKIKALQKLKTAWGKDRRTTSSQGRA